MSTTMTDIIWKPTGQYLKCRAADFITQHGLKDWRHLIKRSTEDTNWFWKEAIDFMGFKWSTPYSQLMDDSKGFEWTKWFVGGELNIVDNVLDWHQTKGQMLGSRTSVGSAHPALIWEGEEGGLRKFNYGELNEMVSKIAGLMLELDVKPGDAVGMYMPMIPETVATLLACFKIGAVAVPVFSGFGSQALVTRLSDAEAKVLFTADGGKRRGKLIEIKNDADEAAKDLPNLKKIVVVKHTQNQISWNKERDVWLHEALENVKPAETKVDLDAEHPSMYLYTSGTTGKPKGTVHTHAGAMAQIVKELGFTFDVRPDDVFFWVSDIGWMMGPWEIIGVYFWGGTIVIFEGAPNHPTPDRVWQIVDRHKVNTLGISPTLIRALRSSGDGWVQTHDLSSLRLLGSTGEPWDEDSYMWYFKNVGKSNCPIMNISGGTELVGGLLTPLPLMPLKPCSLGGPGLGMDIDVFDENGQSVSNSIGHLVCKKPGPSMTKGFLKDPDRYIETYFSKFPGVWYHGDWAKCDEDESWFLFGRSDDTIKVAGKRVGPGEVESVLVEHKDVAEAAVIGVPDDVKGEALVCFVVLMPGKSASTELTKELRDLVAHKLGPVMRPEVIHTVGALPKTRSGKIVRRTIRAMYLGEPTGDLSSVENPDALGPIGKLPGAKG
ncbi:MAG: AMP-binding protein [Candidatus Obscuribacterales bacterium]|nr:AMP-binding protein [Candidatus Obscuribacterales bacterium]